MGFTWGAIPNYIEQENFPLITKALVGGRSAAMMTKQVGVKGDTTLNLMDVDVNMSAGGTCTWAQNGDIDFTQRTINAKQVQINMEFCPDALRGYYLRTQLPSGTPNKELPFEAQFADYLVEKIQDEIEKIIWQGNFGAAGNLGMFDGLLQSTAGFTDCNVAGDFPVPLAAPLAISDMIEAIERIYVTTPAEAVAQGDFKIFVGYDKFRLLASAMMNGQTGLVGAGALGGAQLNGYQSDFDPMRLIFPGTNIEVVAVNGLTGLNGVYGANLSNMVLGVDLESDSSSIETWYSQDDRKYKVAVEFTMGTQVAYPDLIGKVAV